MAAYVAAHTTLWSQASRTFQAIFLRKHLRLLGWGEENSTSFQPPYHSSTSCRKQLCSFYKNYRMCSECQLPWIIYLSTVFVQSWVNLILYFCHDKMDFDNNLNLQSIFNLFKCIVAVTLFQSYKWHILCCGGPQPWYMKIGQHVCYITAVSTSKTP